MLFFDIGEVYNDSKGPIRHFTVLSSPTEDFIMLTTRIRDSPYKQRLASLEKGTRLRLETHRRICNTEDYSKTAIFIFGGIGVTPFRSMVKYATDYSYHLKIIMFDSNKNNENVLFKKEFDEWTNLDKNIDIIYTLTGRKTTQEQQSSTMIVRKGEFGRIDKAMVLRFMDSSTLKDSLFYICGPPNMLKSMESLIQEELKIPKEKIKVEEFTGY